MSNTEKNQEIAASKAGMDPTTARRYLGLGRLPSELKKERPWRTREDPFCEVWDAVQQQIQESPGLEAKTLFEWLQREYPGRFSDGQIRTLQRRIKLWRVPTRPPGGEAWRAKGAPVFRLADVAGFAESGLTLDLAYIEDAVPRDVYAVPAKSVSSFPVPDGATWDELRITVRDTAIVADLRGTSREFGTEELGFAGADDRLWQLLCVFASVGGQTPARNTSVSDKDAITLRKQVSNLRQRLATIFPIAGHSINSVHGTGAYRCIFKIGLDRRDGFPSPPDQWDDCRFTELRDGRISISVKTNEVFAARTISEETQRRTAIEAAERVGIRTEDYDLRAIGLADQSGIPTSEGRLLIELLRSGGKLNRRGDDKDLLRLAQRLRTWMGIDGDPFQFSPSRRLWNAVFECLSHRMTVP